MEFVVGDHSGLCKELSWLSAETRRTRIIKKAKQNRSLEVTSLCWSGPSGGREASEIAVGRACGSVEAFATSSTVCEVPIDDPSPEGESSLNQPLRSFQLPSAPVALSLIGSVEARAHTRSLLCKSWLTSGVTAGEASLRNALQPPTSEAGADAEQDSSCGSGSTRLLLAVGQKGHTCVVEWEGSFSTRLLEMPREAGGVVSSVGEAVEGEQGGVSVQFVPLEKNSNAEPSSVQTESEGNSFCCRVAYLLPAPIAAASSHPLCNSLLAFGGKENDAKVVDLDYGKILWAAKNVKPSFLGLRCDVAVTQVEWLLPIHPMVLSVGTAKGAMRFYDLRCQRRPVLEVCEATQEKRPITALCVHPTAEVLQSKTDMRAALIREAETAASSSCCEPSASHVYTTVAGVNSHLSRKKGYPGGSGQSSCGNTAANEPAENLLASCSGKDSATVYFADSHGMIYGMRVHSGSALMRLVDKTCPKYNPSSYRSFNAVSEADWSPEVKRKLIAEMLDKQRRKLSSKKNDRPVCTAACVDLQLAAASCGGFKGAMGAIMGLKIDPSGEHLIAVGLGRYAYVFNAKSRKLCGQVFLKQKLTCLLAGGGELAGGIRRHARTRQRANSGGKNSGSDASSSEREEGDASSSEQEEGNDSSSEQGGGDDSSSEQEEGDASSSEQEEGNASDSSNNPAGYCATGGADSKWKPERHSGKQPTGIAVTTNKRSAAIDNNSKKRKRFIKPPAQAGRRLG